MREDEGHRTLVERRQRLAKRLIFGMALLLAAHVVAAIALVGIFYGAKWIGWYLVASVALGSLVLFGTTQVLYAIPLALWLQQQRQFRALQGVAIGSVITVLLNIGALFYVARFTNLTL